MNIRPEKVELDINEPDMDEDKEIFQACGPVIPTRLVLVFCLFKGGFMSLAKGFIKEFEKLPDAKKAEVIDFIEFLKTREKKNLEALMNSIATEN